MSGFVFASSPLKALRRVVLPLLAAVGLAPAALAVTVTPLALNKDEVAAAFRPRRLALFVGVQRFSDARFRPLRYAEKDAHDFASFLKAHNDTPLDERIELTSEGATTKALAAALDELERKNTSEDDIVLVYLSTHGSLAYQNATQLTRFAVLYDTAFDDIAGTGMPLDFIQNRLSRMRSQRKALILAMCHSGTGKSQLPPDVAQSLATMKAAFFVQPLHEVSTAMMVLSASAWGQPAAEDESLKNDIYTRFLLDGLAKNEASGDAVTLFEAHEFARSRTYDYTRGLQTPTAVMNMVGDDPIILSGRVKRAKNPLVFADAEQYRNVRLYVDGVSKGTLWHPQRLEPGSVRLTLVDPASPETPLLDRHIYMQQDKAYPASTLVAHQPTLGGEVRLYDLPLPSALDGVAPAGLWAPGVALRSSEFLGTRLTGMLGYFNHQVRGTTALDGVASPATLDVAAWRAALGASFYPLRAASLTAFVGGETLQLNRVVANATLARVSQKLSVTYPVLTSELRFLDLFGPVYAGAAVDVYPMRSVGLKVDGASRPLRPASGSGFVGFTF